jgi:hypothetical protein
VYSFISDELNINNYLKRQILWSFVICGNLVYFPHFGILCQEKSGNPVSDAVMIQSLCDCLLWTVVLKITEVARILECRVCTRIDFGKKWVGLHFGHLFTSSSGHTGSHPVRLPPKDLS